MVEGDGKAETGAELAKTIAKDLKFEKEDDKFSFWLSIQSLNPLFLCRIGLYVYRYIKTFKPPRPCLWYERGYILKAVSNDQGGWVENNLHTMVTSRNGVENRFSQHLFHNVDET